MHKENFKKIQIEIGKITKETQGVIDKLIDKENENNPKTTNKKKTLSVKNLNEHKNILIAEAQKLKNLEYVVAVVGTMKAGKSMTINAIVGQEILPSREHPMTTLPTLITHVPKQIEPKLIIKKIEPFRDLRDKIRLKITNDINANDDIKDLLSRIKNEKIEFKTEYNGQNKISKFLKDINDLMRIAKEFDIEPPYEEYTNVDDLPRIEVEFYHLSKYTQEASEARLTLLDTPGPDEFNQSDILKTIFKEQLKKASAVTLVVDYTKMNSESDAEVKEQIEDVTKMLGKKHLFVLLNKFDQRGRGKDESIQKQEAIRLISEGILKDKIDEKNVYPVASKNAFYANLGLCELAKNNKISEELAWRESFAVAILGEDWEDDIDDIKRIEKKCKKYWDKSYLEEPLNNIIATIHNDALALALEAPLEKLTYILEQIFNGLRVKENALFQNLTDLKANIKKLQEDISKISVIAEIIQKDTDRDLDLIKEDMSQIINEQLKNSEKEILAPFNMILDDKRKKMIKEEEKNNLRRDKRKLWERLLGGVT